MHIDKPVLFCKCHNLFNVAVSVMSPHGADVDHRRRLFTGQNHSKNLISNSNPLYRVSYL